MNNVLDEFSINKPETEIDIPFDEIKRSLVWMLIYAIAASLMILYRCYILSYQFYFFRSLKSGLSVMYLLLSLGEIAVGGLSLFYIVRYYQTMHKMHSVQNAALLKEGSEYFLRYIMMAILMVALLFVSQVLPPYFTSSSYRSF